MNLPDKPISLIGDQYALPNVSPLAPDDFRDLVKRRAASILHISPNEHEWENNEELRRETENLILEKIIRENNLLPIEFLSKGLEMAKAVCRFVTPSGVGTGFMIGKGMVMTNHHVLEDADTAENSFVEFDYEEHKQAIEVKLKPAELFITSPFEELDFTIVACETTGIEQVTPIKLLRNPTTITRGEYVNIIQHPRGRKKEVALQDNTVSYVYDKVIHYSTDTERGSSGSAVFNNDWQLVALHHAGFAKEGSTVNEGIRISAIVSKLISLAVAGDEGAARVVRTLEDTSPYLGFYDVKGLVDTPRDSAEIEVPTFKGDKRFADIGFWNIEHFNNAVNEQRINDVAKVIYDLSMDALGLVEVEKGALQRLMVALVEEHGAKMDYVYLETQGAQDLAVVFDTSTTKVELRSDINQKYSSLLRSTIENRPAFPNQREPLFAMCTIKEEGQNIQFLMIVCHLKAMRDERSQKQRKLAAQVLSVIIEDLKQDRVFKDLPIVLGGDLNDDADSDSLSQLMNSRSLVTLTRDDAAAGHISYLKEPWHSLIDHIVVSKDMKVHVGAIEDDDAAIVRLDRSLQHFVRNISDHAPLVLRVIYKDGDEEETERINFPVQYLDESTLERTLLRLQLNRGNLELERPYYNEDKDRVAMVDYYRSVNLQASNGSELYQTLHRLLLDTHTTILSYRRSRSELYSWIDLRENGALRSLYSGKDLDAERLIREDHRFEQQKTKLFTSLSRSEFVDEEELLHMLEERFQFNIEHVVPQSWFNRLSPMVGDLHHLFVCESECNSFRGNIPYYDFADYNPEAYTETIRTKCGKRGGNSKFEPESGKGEAARAVLYFLLRYPGKIKNDLVSKVNWELLLTWHHAHPVTLHEKHRNQAIYEAQGNRNPLIDFPECADNINFSLGL
ncbi:endonuclease [Paenibacillus apiarius]|uniref:Serine protease n=1 Tax=Paenibacillus apiarius TaxID=46240 RepID=A0ABT4E106_9BACL|nr:endonuclease [Paenibacillus apiarius]MCY9517845.1 endonuclease [Paenibacillus apiarius]MCY9522690.1 endonuclease [Paenibacillus apiarius]MCY9555375.1 endonuclease [Paenibacillus apiarius]MCY9561255.1 endonuclease [Paenibacillus apiarius]MCY9686552.1 endonuclease [Paenibacillus apiarius]